MYIIVIRNQFLWDPHMQIYFYWLYHIKKSLCHIVNCIGFNRWYYLLAAWVQGLGCCNKISFLIHKADRSCTGGNNQVFNIKDTFRPL